jgi:hypothetical protein
MKRKHQKEWELLEQYPIGTKVSVQACLVDISNPGAHVWVVQPCTPFIAWVSGCSWRCDGPVNHGGGTYDDYEPGYMVITKKTPVLLVRKFSFGKEIEVPVTEVVKITAKGFLLSAPLLTTARTEWSERDKAALRGEMKNVPRDEKGRWKKTQF